MPEHVKLSEKLSGHAMLIFLKTLAGSMDQLPISVNSRRNRDV